MYCYRTLLGPGLPNTVCFVLSLRMVSEVQKVRTDIHLDYSLSFTYDKPVSVPDETNPTSPHLQFRFLPT